MREFILGSAFVLLCTSSHLTAQEPATGPLLPGNGVADAAKKIGFFPNTSGGIDALDLKTGKILWTVAEVDRPLLASDARLIAQSGKTNKIRIVILDIPTGKRIVESDEIALPDWATVGTAYGRSFHSAAKIGDKDVSVRWQANAFYAGGARPTPKIEEAARKNAIGVARIDLATGKVENLSADDAKKFAMPDVKFAPQLDTLTIAVNDTAKNPKMPFQMRRVLRVTDSTSGATWEREIAAPIILPPRP